MTRNCFYKIKDTINWRKECDTFILLHPQTKRLLFFNKDISFSISSEGIIHSTEENRNLIRSFLEEKIIKKIKKPPFEREFSYKNLSSPFNATIQITNRCNLNCVHCHRDSENKKTLDFKKFKELVTELRKLNVFNVNLSGGEPLLVPGLIKMVETIDNLGMKVTISTNGILLTQNLVRKLKKAGLKYLQISLDSDNPRNHNKIRGSESAFLKTLSNLIFLKKEEIDFAIVTTLINQSPKEYGRIIDSAYNLGASAHKTNTFIPSLNTDIRNFSQLKSFRLVSQFINMWKRKKDQYKGKMLLLAETMFAIQIGKDYVNPFGLPSVFNLGCPAGFLTCAINQKGDVLPCPFFSKLIFGNIYQNSFNHIWNNNNTAKKFRNRNGINICGKCQYEQICGGCRARSFGMFKKLNQKDPFCFKFNTL